MAGKKAKNASRRTGQGSVYERKDGRWGWGITHAYNENGNPVRYQGIKGSQAAALAELNKVLTRLNLGVPAEDEKQTLGEFLDFWLQESVKGKLAPKTCRFYEQMVRLYIKPDLGHLSLGKLSPQHIQSFLNQRAKKARSMTKTVKGKKVTVTLPPLTARSIGHIRAVLRSALGTAWKWGRIRENHALKVTPPKIESKEPVYLTPEEVKALIAKSAEHHLGALFVVAVNTGLRLGEATGLTWTDVDLEKGTITVKSQLQRVDGTFALWPLKSRSSRRALPLTADASNALKAQRANQLLWGAVEGEPFNAMNLCFTSPAGCPLDPSTVGKHLKALVKGAEISKPITFHTLRHTTGTHLASQGVPMNVIKEILGHSQIAVTMNLYAHAVPAAHRTAFDALEQAYRDHEPNG